MASGRPPGDELSDLILSLKQAINTYGASHLLNTVDLDAVKNIEAAAAADPASPYTKWLREARTHALKALSHIQDYAALIGLANTLAEARMYAELKPALPALERVPEAATARPDFRWSANGATAYIEAKTLDLSAGEAHHEAVMRRALGAKVDIEEQLAKGNRVAWSEWEVAPLSSPYERSGRPDDPRSRRQVIERIIERLEPYSSGQQLKLGPTILLVNLERLVVPPTHGAGSMVPEFLDVATGSRVSGVLWHVAFGRRRRRIFREPEFEGASNADGLLGRRGILRAYRDVAAILFRVDGKYCGAVRRTKSPPTVDVLIHTVTNDVASA